MISLNLIFDRVLIERSDSNTQKKMAKSGLILPDTVEYKASQGRLIQCGDGCDDAVKALVGKDVLFTKFSGDEVKLNGKEFLLATDRDILGGLEDDGTE